MIVPGSASPLLTTTDGGYTIAKSLRLRASAGAYLSRTPASSGNRKTWTWSAWVKRGTLGSGQYLLALGASYTDTGFMGIGFANDGTNTDCFNITTGTQVLRRSSNQLRDPSAWYHLMIAFDTTLSTAADRVKMYINGTQVTSFVLSNNPTQNTDYGVNQAIITYICRNSVGADTYFDGYIADQYFIDGQALTPSSFGETDSVTGVWKPKAYSGTYGTNGFYLKFTDVATTSGSNAGLGKDFSGNGNYWTTNNISVTSGSTYDSMTDVPTLTNSTTANYAVLNPLITLSGTISDSNLKNVFLGTATNNCSSTMFSNSGKFYVEVTPSALSGNAGEVLLGDDNNGIAVGYRSTGTKDVDSYSTNSAYGATWTVGDVIGMAADITNKSVTFYKNGVSQGEITYTGSAAKTSLGVVVTTRNSVNMTFTVNYGQQPWAYSPPSGYSAWNTYNLPDSTIVAGNKYMDATTYTANGGVQTVTNAGGFKPDFVWNKTRSISGSHNLVDSVRGISKYLFSNSTAAEGTDANYLTALNSDGFSLGSTNFSNGTTMVAWQWQAGQGTTSSNTNGSITSTVSLNATAGFSVVTYTGTGSNATVGHGLGVAPSMIIVKSRSTADDWYVKHSSYSSNDYYQQLNLTNAIGSSSTIWNSAAPTSSVFSVGTSGATNRNGDNFVAYCWAEIAGFSKFGSYTGNGSTDGPFVYLGFRPKWLLIKVSSGTTNNWLLEDTTRTTKNVMGAYLFPNLSDAEGTNVYADFLSNGFKIRDNGASYNGSGYTYIYAAFAENPFKNALAR